MNEHDNRYDTCTYCYKLSSKEKTNNNFVTVQNGYSLVVFVVYRWNTNIKTSKTMRRTGSTPIGMRMSHHRFYTVRVKKVLPTNTNLFNRLLFFLFAIVPRRPSNSFLRLLFYKKTRSPFGSI